MTTQPTDERVEEREHWRGIKQGTLYGYDVVLMAPKKAVSDVINENTLEKYIADLLTKSECTERNQPTAK